MTSLSVDSAARRAAQRDEMVRTMCMAVDTGDAEAFGSYFTDDALYRPGDAEPIFERAAVVEAPKGAVTALPWVRHTIEQVAQIGEQLFCRFIMHSTAPTGENVSMPCVRVIGLVGEQIVDYRVHVDLSPAFGG